MISLSPVTQPVKEEKQNKTKPKLTSTVQCLSMMMGVFFTCSILSHEWNEDK